MRDALGKDLGSGSLKAITFFGPDLRRRTFAMTYLLCHQSYLEHPRHTHLARLIASRWPAIRIPDPSTTSAARAH